MVCIFIDDFGCEESGKMLILAVLFHGHFNREIIVSYKGLLVLCCKSIQCLLHFAPNFLFAYVFPLIYIAVCFPPGF